MDKAESIFCALHLKDPQISSRNFVEKRRFGDLTVYLYICAHITKCTEVLNNHNPS